MWPLPPVRTRKLTIVAQDPGIRHNNSIVTAEVDIPAEELGKGPRGYRVHVIDYDASTRTLYKPYEYKSTKSDKYPDPFKEVTKHTLLHDPGFHAQNVYAIVMRTLARFEYSLGRRVNWSFQGHQIKAAPHAFSDANAFYSQRDEALLFGYFPGKKGTIFSCLSHDVIAHETTHALLDGLHCCYIEPSSEDQPAFHEGLADIIALLSVFSLREVVKVVLDLGKGKSTLQKPGLIEAKNLRPDRLKQTLLFGVAEEMGKELSCVRGKALRQSLDLDASPDLIGKDEFKEPHRRGEILVAAMMNAFIEVWMNRLISLGRIDKEYLDRERTAEEAADAADYLLTMTIRALDYCPPIHLEFGDFLSALLTADHEIRPDDSRYQFRKHILKWFKKFGIEPSSKGKSAEESGIWDTPEEELSYDRLHFEALARDKDEMFRFVWENRKELKLDDGAVSKIESLRPCLRIGPDDGFPLREIVAECVQYLKLEASELRRKNLKRPEGMPSNQEIVLRGGMTLVFNEFGRLKFSIGKNILNKDEQQKYLDYLWETGYFHPKWTLRRRFSNMHRSRGTQSRENFQEEW